MTKGLIVTLQDDTSEDDAEYAKNAIKMIKGVLSVENLETNWEDKIIEKI